MQNIVIQRIKTAIAEAIAIVLIAFCYLSSFACIWITIW